MNNIAVIASSVVVGAAVGAFVSYKVTKSKIERAAKQEIEEIREYYKNKYAKVKEEETQPEQQTAEQPQEDSEEKDKEEYGLEPYVISPDEFGELYDYDPVTLILYKDGILAYEDGVRVEDVDDVVGIESLNTFGRYEDDCVYVRNENMKCDYEILRDEARYSDLYENKSRQSEK